MGGSQRNSIGVKGIPCLLIVLGAVCIWPALISLTVVSAWAGWWVSGTDTGAWIGGTVVFTAGLWCISRFGIRDNPGERGCLLIIVITLEVLLYLAWLMCLKAASHLPHAG